jgi:ornithine carbamoyltransferase
MKIPKLKTKDLLTITELDKNEIISIYRLTEQLKKDLKKGIHHNLLQKKTLAMIFEKSSTRTRVSFETGIIQLGGYALFLSGNDIQIGRGEPLSDTARVLSRYVDGIMVRTFSHENAILLAEYSNIPVINGLTDSFHPCQALTDYFTIFEREKDFSDTRIVYIGDGNNVSNSLILGAAILGINITVACPEGYFPPQDVVNEALKLASNSGADIHITADIHKAVSDADYLYTDVWTSMGQEEESDKRRSDFSGYKITMDLIKKARKGCKVMHCLPAHRGEEIDADVIESDSSIIFDQAENRMHVQKAIMCALMSEH